MKTPPALIGFKFRPAAWPLPTLWLPVFLFWPFGALFLLFVFVIGIVATALARPRDLSRFYAAFGAFYSLVCEMRGTRVDVEGDHGKIFITVV